MTYTIHTNPDGSKTRTLDVSNYERKVQAKLVADRADSQKERHLAILRHHRKVVEHKYPSFK